MAFNTQEQQIIQWGIQNKKSKDEVTQAISNLRSGTIVKPQEEEKPNYFQRVGQDFQRAGERITTGIKEGATGIQQGDKFAGIEAGLRTVGSIAGAAFAPIMEAPGIKQATEAVVGGAMKIPAVQTLAQKGVELSQKYPNASKDIEDLINIATLGIGSTVEKPIQKVATDTAKGIAKGTENIASGVSKQVGKLAPKSEEIMNRVARLTPKEANNFSKLSGGVSHGEYLTKTGNFGAPDQIITKEAEKFAQSLSSKKAALAELPGVYKDGSLDDALDMLIAKAKNESGNNVKSPYLDEVLNLKTKLDNEGLTMLEGEAVKSLLERNVKLGYNRLTNGEKVTQATNIDNAIREWQLGKAEELGFTNLREINKQTQLSRFIVNKLGDQVVGKTGLNNVGLTDWIMLSGGDPTAVGGFLTKRFFSNKSVQARIAKMLSKEAPVGQIEPKVTPSKLQSPQSPKIQSEKALPKSSTIPKTKSSPKGLLQSAKDNLKNPRNSQGGFIKNPLSKDIAPAKQSVLNESVSSSNLITEAKKYKTAEDFVKAQGGVGDSIAKAMQKEFELEKLTDELSKKANSFSGKGGIVTDKSSEYLKVKEELNKAMSEYNAFKKSELGKIVQQERRKLPIQVRMKMLKGNIQTKSQLTKIWNDVNSPKGKGTIPENSLISEAKKYKSAEEFVKAQGTPVYHGTQRNFDNFDIKQAGTRNPNDSGYAGKGIYFTNVKDIAKTFAEGKDIYKTTGKIENNGRIIEAYIKTNKILEVDNFTELNKKLGLTLSKDRPKEMGLTEFIKQQSSKIQEKAKNLGYDGIKVDAGGTKGEFELVIFDSSKIKTKSQLIDTWNKVNKK